MIKISTLWRDISYRAILGTEISNSNIIIMADQSEVDQGKSEPKSIKLPGTVEIFSNLKNAKRFAIDIGKFK